LEAVAEEKAPWETAYLRIDVGDGHAGVEASYVMAGKAVLFGEADAMRTVCDLGLTLWRELKNAGHPFEVLLMTLQSDGRYEVDFERHNADRWQIRLDKGYDGIPRD
jgi:hypothetical protein